MNIRDISTTSSTRSLGATAVQPTDVLKDATATLQQIAVDAVDAMGGRKAEVLAQPPLPPAAALDYSQFGGGGGLGEADVTDMMKRLGLNMGDRLTDPKSVESIKQVQNAFGLPETGQFDLETMMALIQAQANNDRRTQAGQSKPASMKELANTQRSESLSPEQASAYNYKAGDVTPEKLQKMCPGLSAEKAKEVAPHLNQAMQEAGINTPGRQAAFIAQVGHESGNFKYSEEIASGKAYEGRRDLGNTQPGDGERFKGRGYIQLTGRANYAAAGKALGLDLVNNPKLAARPENAARIAAWYWNSRGLNAKADAGKFDAITRSINGGTNGAADRNQRYQAALRAVGTKDTQLA